MTVPPMKITDTPSIERLKELSAKATPGEWELASDDDFFVIAYPDGVATIIADLDPPGQRTALEMEVNAELIAAAVNYVRAALETLTPSAGEGVERREALEAAAKLIENGWVKAGPGMSRYDGPSIRELPDAIRALTASPPPQPDIEGRAKAARAALNDGGSDAE